MRMSLLSRVGNIMALLPNKLYYVISKVQYPYLVPEESSDVFLCGAERRQACKCVCLEVTLIFTHPHMNTEYLEWSCHLLFFIKLALYTFFVCICQLSDIIQRLWKVELMAATKANISHF